MNEYSGLKDAFVIKIKILLILYIWLLKKLFLLA